MGKFKGKNAVGDNKYARHKAIGTIHCIDCIDKAYRKEQDQWQSNKRETEQPIHNRHPDIGRHNLGHQQKHTQHKHRFAGDAHLG